MHTQRVGLQTSGDASLGQRIGMDGDEKVCLVAVGNICTGMQGHEHIRLAGIDDAHIGTVALHQSAKGKCHIQVDVLLFGDCADCSCVRAAVPGINNQCEFLVCSRCYSHKQTRYPYQRY